MAAVRFALDETNERLDAQCLLWPGGMDPWFPCSERLAARDAEDVADLYYQEFGDGERVHSSGHWAPAPWWIPDPVADPSANRSRNEFLTWLGVGTAWGQTILPYASTLSDPSTRVLAVDTDQLGGQQCIVIRTARSEYPGLLEELRLWVAPAYAYAPVRGEALVEMDEPNPWGETGWVETRTWADLTEVGGVFIARQYERRRYGYGYGGARGPDSVKFTGSRRVSFLSLEVGEPVSFDLRTDPGPIAADVAAPAPYVSQAEADELSKTSREFRRRLSAFRNEAPPVVDTEMKALVPTAALDRRKKELGF